MKRAPFQVEFYGFGVFGTLAGLVAGAVGYLILKSLQNTPDSLGVGFGIAILGLWVYGGFCVLTIVGGSVGARVLSARWYRQGLWPRPLWLGFVLGPIPILFVVLPPLYVFGVFDRPPANAPMASSPSVAVKPPIRSSPPAPPEFPSPQQMLGDLYFTGSQFDLATSIANPRQENEPIWPAILMIPPDGTTEQTLRNFYAPRVRDAHTEEASWLGDLKRPYDGVTVSVVVTIGRQGIGQGKPVVAFIVK